jgi:tetratricopeptide (TPR) repeat protein
MMNSRISNDITRLSVHQPAQTPHRFSRAVICTFALALFLAAQAGATARDPVFADLIQQWNQIKAQSPDTGRIGGLIVEGDRIIERLQELDALNRNPKSHPGTSYNQRIASLQDRFKALLAQIEMTRIAGFPTEELQAMKSRYEAERRQLQEETRALEDSIIVRGEYFLNTYKQNLAYSYYFNKQEMIVDFLYRLAEIYYRRAEETFFETNDIAVFKPALEKYQRIIDDFPASEYVDDALYNIAYVKNSSRSPDDQQEAIKLYKTLIEKYADSPFRAEAFWRVGEYYFYQDPPQIPEAIQYYSALLDFPDTHWYARGLYKIGWCHFRNSEYPEAIEYFTRTVETSLDTTAAAQDVLFASMMDEALEYISVCFAQEPGEWEGAGVPAAVAFVQADSVRRATYGKKIIEYLGDIYKFQIGKYALAAEAYTAYLDLYPLGTEAPWVQEKVINLYAVNLRDFPRAYEEKNRIFEQYRRGTAWDAAHPDSTLRREADAVIEKYYFQSIGETIGRAMKNNDPALFELAVAMSRKYLEEYPQGPNAYTVNYNMAVLLVQNIADDQQAYAEFIKVSRDYPDDTHRKESAVNAVIIAQRMISSSGGLPLDSLKGTPLSDAEEKYLAAVDNYLEHFPQGEEAELFLLNAGSIYYNHGRFADSRVYYERLLSEFPEGMRRGDAYKYIMNGYFAEGDYADAERAAKEIQAAGFDSALVAAAKTRQAESVFLTAQGLKEQADFLKAADEYKRAALESPDYAQADKALFESGLAYQQAKAWPQANEVYTILVSRYPKSELADKALYNMAYNSQSELGDKSTAAATFERLAMEYPQSPLAQDALRNASINYVEAQDWAGAIRVNTAYTQMFSGAPDANLFLFENAGLYLKLGDESSAERIYAEYTRRFPNDPRTVRAHWERGAYLQEHNRPDEAYAEFSAGIQTHRNLIAGGHAGEETYASRCLLEVIRSDFAAYEAIQFAPASAVEQNKELKLAKRDQLLNLLEELNHMAKDEMLEGLYSVGKVEEDLSIAFERQELAAKESPEENILRREVANQDAIEISLRAISAYRKAADDIATAKSVLTAKEAELAARLDSLGAWVTAAQKSDPQPPDLPDSTAALSELDRGLKEIQAGIAKAEEWSNRARAKIPELALRNAEIKFATVKAFLALPDVGKNEDLKMLYRSAVLSDFAAPRGAEVIRLYRNAITESASGPNADEWKARALNGVRELFSALENEYKNLNERALSAYVQEFATYQDLLEQGEGARTKKGQEAADIAERLVLFSDQSFEYGKGALAAQSALLEAAEQGDEIPQELRAQLVASAIEEVFRIGDRYSSLATTASAAQARAKERQSESVVWEDAVMTFEDCAYNFSGHQEALLAAALDFNKAHGDDRALALRIAWALADLDRETYLPLLAQYGDERWVRSDETFLVSPCYRENWDQINCTESDWKKPVFTQHPGHEADELSASKAIWTDLSADSVKCDSLYLRKVFEIQQEPVAGDLWISVTGGYSLLVNGEFIGAVAPGEETADPQHYDVATYLKSGKNLISVLAVEPDSVNNGVLLALRYKVLPLQSYGGP